MPSDLYPPDLSRWETLARRVVLAAVITAAAVTLLAMGLSYNGLRWAYLGAGFGSRVAALAPFVIDPLFLVTYLALLVLPGKRYPLAVLIFGVALSAGIQGYHSSHGGIDSKITDGRITALLGASFMVFAGLALHLLWKILERALPADFITAMRGVEAPRPVLTVHQPPPVERRTTDQLVAEVRRLNHEAFDPKPQVSAAAQVPRKASVTKIVAPSLRAGPCHPDCRHHAGRGDVSKTTRYRCQKTLNGTATGPDACKPCLKAMGERDG